MRHWSILGTVSILSSLGMFAPLGWAQTKQSDFTPSSQSNQTAQTKQINFTLSSESNQTFAALMQQAESLATSFIQQGFAQSPSLTKISVKILGERNGQEVPLLFSIVSRFDWQKQPRIQKWTRYFGTSAVLLGFLKPQVEESAPADSPDTSIQESAPPSSADNPIIQESAPPSSADNPIIQESAPPSSTDNPIIQESAPPSSTDTSIQESNPSPFPDTSIPTGARLEENDSNVR